MGIVSPWHKIWKSFVVKRARSICRWDLVKMFYTLTAVLFAGLALGDCDADNCLRALRATQTPGRLEAAQSFCATFTTTSVAATAIPSYAAKACQSNQVGDESFRISSACTCIATSATSITATSTITAGACATVSSLSAAFKAVSPSGIPPKISSESRTNSTQQLQQYPLLSLNHVLNQCH